MMITVRKRAYWTRLASLYPELSIRRWRIIESAACKRALLSSDLLMVRPWRDCRRDLNAHYSRSPGAARTALCICAALPLRARAGVSVEDNLLHAARQDFAWRRWPKSIRAFGLLLALAGHRWRGNRVHAACWSETK